ncbi:hypothetical protein F4679DRAFT_435556 [Xylaria curta]|nr:hypothetical protein F4679DRAFT_435556 [Xylaria curta]
MKYVYSLLRYSKEQTAEKPITYSKVIDSCTVYVSRPTFLNCFQKRCCSKWVAAFLSLALKGRSFLFDSSISQRAHKRLRDVMCFVTALLDFQFLYCTVNDLHCSTYLGDFALNSRSLQTKPALSSKSNRDPRISTLLNGSATAYNLSVVVFLTPPPVPCRRLCLTLRSHQPVHSLPRWAMVYSSDVPLVLLCCCRRSLRASFDYRSVR